MVGMAVLAGDMVEVASPVAVVVLIERQQLTWLSSKKEPRSTSIRGCRDIAALIRN